ncbi:zinc dependent phospholipase C family protein [Geosporobacter ferrireducens]|uniref:Phospholipase C/D domain-containing protein n=1 Tax=Geosporobacter ferrireducens TaxID=1424294 RepID=A0A1D8GD21_9FIRM|nr:zinc dependent phospholipase C family protein [Geosporobacter ferrireducens]AOT68796.1 hypothetical protein Gferi_04005 [Geosporobacter ferrireducens]
MLIQSHKLISEKVHANLQRHLGIELHKGFFIYGNIKPDISPYLSKIPHYVNESLSFISNEIYHLSNTPFSKDKAFIKQFSIQLGVITHYISDYFCHPHHDRETYKNHLIEHLKYESLLHEHIKHLPYLFDKDMYYTCKLNGNADALSQILEDLFNRYTCNAPSFQNDVCHALKASSSIALLITYNAMHAKEKQPIITAA